LFSDLTNFHEPAFSKFYHALQPYWQFTEAELSELLKVPPTKNGQKYHFLNSASKFCDGINGQVARKNDIGLICVECYAN